MKKIEMRPITSSQIKSVGYDATYGTLYIEFLTGSVYRYLDVPATHFEMLITPTLSAGRYFGQEIKGKFDYEKLSNVIVVEGYIEL
jgi:hypothetical protein